MLKLNTIFTIFTLFVLSYNSVCQDFYDINTINTIEITFQQSNWDEILDSLKLAGNEDRLMGSALINGMSFDSIGVRYKGNSSYSPNNAKNPLNIKLDYTINNQHIQEYGTLKLANGFKDPSFIRESLGYEIANKYMPSSKANYMNVYINGTYMGLYTSVQDVDKYFMRTHFHSDENARFKGELSQSGPPSSHTIWGYYGPDSTSYYNYYELDSDKGWRELISFLDTLNNYNLNVENVLNIDRHLWMLAFDILMVNLDAPVNFGHNYYLYKDDAGLFNPIIWDLNENFGGFSMLLSGGSPMNVTQMQQMDPYLHSTHPDYPIINKILSNSTYKKMYVAHMKTIIDENFSNGWYSNRALEIQAIIDSTIQSDPNQFYTYSDFLNNINNTVGGGGPPGPGNQPIVGITELMNARVTFLNSHPDFITAAPVITNITNTPANAMPNSQVWINVDVSTADSVKLAFRHSVSDKFTKTEMFDDGNHNDGSTGDGNYGVSLSTGSANINYYIYAENNDAAMFSPQRAEFEYYTLLITGDLVINEFMAKNDNTVSDQDGEYDDWIELFNNSNSPISLNGYYLTDEGTDLVQWIFPDTSIAANDYLIIWADDDGGQNGLHANFKISASGEALYLVSPDTGIVDEVTFGAQTADISTGRYPNGTGDFIQMSPTYAATNINGITGVKNENNTNPTKYALKPNYPNPFNPSTTIEFSLPKSEFVTLKIYNLLGQEVTTLVSDNLAPGVYKYTWEAGSLASGVYMYNIQAGAYQQVRKMIYMK